MQTNIEVLQHNYIFCMSCPRPNAVLRRKLPDLRTTEANRDVDLLNGFASLSLMAGQDRVPVSSPVICEVATAKPIKQRSRQFFCFILVAGNGYVTNVTCLHK
jgi:hypothetical protein